MKLAEVTRGVLDGRVDAETHARGRERMQAALLRRARGRYVSRGLLLLVAATIALVLGLVWWPRPPLTFTVDGGVATATADGGMWLVTDDGPSVASFSDGSTVRFAPDTSGRFEGVGADGARVVLSGGELHLDIRHRDGTSWSVEAGPYLVRVTGTEFDVVWRPNDGIFLVSMQHGSVVVEGPLTPKGLVLSAGQHVQVAGGVLRLGEGRAPLLASAAPAEAASSSGVIDTPKPAASPAVVASAEPLASASAALASSSAASEKAASLGALVADGKYAEVVKLAHARGLDWVQTSASLEDLSALADAARYAKDGALARAALEAQRKRFGSTQAGRNATFLLGRMAEDADGNTSRAIALYDEYLAGGGSFAAEALGRKMLAVQRTKGDAGARPIAESYLEKYPKGAFASAARSIVGAQ